MAELSKPKDHSFFIVLVTFATVLLRLALSRTLPLSTAATVSLDVSFSLRQAHDVFSVTPTTQQLLQKRRTRQQHGPYSSSFVLDIHPRSSLTKKEAKSQSQHADYIALTLARLAGDSARVQSLSARVDLALNRISKSDLHPVDVEPERIYGAEGLQGPLVSGTSQGSGEYFSRLGIGTPARQVYLVIDTGSDVNWVQCAPCADCYQQSDPIFEPSSSSSFSPLSCISAQCRSLDLSECRNASCIYEVSYGDGSFTLGDFVTESITLGSAKIDNVAIGCGHTNEGLFIGAAGLLGLGGGPLSFPSQLNATSYSYCLVDRDSDSASTLEFNTLMPPNAVTVPMLRNPHVETFMYVAMTGISVGGDRLPLADSMFKLDTSGNGGVIVDSGTAVTRLQTDAYNSLRDAFKRGTKDLPVAEGFALFDTCYDLSANATVEVPTVSFHFGEEGRELPLPAKNYMIPVDTNGTFCLAFAPTSSAPSIIGNVQQQGTRVGFDLDKSVIGFVPNEC